MTEERRALSAGYKRNKSEIERDRLLVARLHLKNWSEWEITGYINADTDGAGRSYTLSRTTIRNDLQVSINRWKESAKQDIQSRVAVELKKLEELEKEAAAEYERSKADKTETEFTATREADGSLGKGKPLKIKKTTSTAAAAFLAVQLQCVERRCKMLGIDAPEEVKLTNDGPIEFILKIKPEELP